MDFHKLRLAVHTPCDKAAYLTMWHFHNRGYLIPEPVVRVVLDDPRVHNGTWVGDDENGFGLRYAGVFTQKPRQFSMEGTVQAVCGAWKIAQGFAPVSGWADYSTLDESHSDMHVHVGGSTRISLLDDYEKVLSWLGTGFSDDFKDLLQSHSADVTELWNFEGHQLNSTRSKGGIPNG